jgi:hypothetical protein
MRRRKWDHLDPRHPQVMALLADLDAEAELVARMALAGLCPKCRGDGAWKARTEELRSAIIRSTDDLARVLARSREFEANLREALDEGDSELIEG